MMPTQIKVTSQATICEPELRYVFKLLSINVGHPIELISTDASLTIGTDSTDTITISENFIEGSLNSSEMNGEGFFTLHDGRKDYVSTAFFCINCMQELQEHRRDSLVRFPYAYSYQSKQGTTTANIVQRCFDALAALVNISPPKKKSSFFLSHDIDTVYGGFKEDGYHVLKKGRVDLFLKMLFNLAMNKPEWLNIDQIMKLESEYDCRSVFYWIVKKGKLDAIQVNADYEFKSPKTQQLLRAVEASGFENGLHKSLSADTFESEMNQFSKAPIGNRYHYLKFNLPEGFESIENAGLELDASLGFSETWGFRNNYGLPFNPYNFKKRAPFTFVEVPLHVMDRTFFSKKMNIADVERAIFEFFEKNKENAVLSVLWHNNFFTEYKYKGYLSLYKKILAYIRDGNFGTLDQRTIIKNYGITWP